MGSGAFFLNDFLQYVGRQLFMTETTGQVRKMLSDMIQPGLTGPVQTRDERIFRTV